MNIKNKEKEQAGSALLMALLVALILSTTLGSYLYLVVNERTLAARSLAWNSAIPVAEAGVEEALTQLYYSGTNNLATNGWSRGNDGMYHKTRALSSGNYYGTAIQLAAYPIIWSTGRVSAPFAGTNAYISRLLKVTTAQMLTYGGIIAKKQITFTGNGYLDSFDSTDANHSNPDGTYNPALRTANAVALSNTNAAGAISLDSNSYIAGTAVTGPGGTVTGTVGDLAWVAGSSGVEANHSRNDANVQINDVATPSFGSFSIVLPTSVTVSGTNYDYGVGTGNYVLPSLTLSSKQTLVVNGNAVIYCTSTASGCVSITGQSSIYITPGSSLKLYLAGPSQIAGQGAVNATGHASNLLIYGLPTCTSVLYAGNAMFSGVVNTPEADFSFVGNASACGSFIANTVTVNGNGGVHYDTSLGGISKGYMVTSWNEIAGH
jgi:hypothetical protein